MGDLGTAVLLKHETVLLRCPDRSFRAIGKPDELFTRTVIHLDPHLDEDLGYPTKVTVSIERGDTLNKED